MTNHSNESQPPNSGPEFENPAKLWEALTDKKSIKNLERMARLATDGMQEAAYAIYSQPEGYEVSDLLIPDPEQSSGVRSLYKFGYGYISVDTDPLTHIPGVVDKDDTDELESKKFRSDVAALVHSHSTTHRSPSIHALYPSPEDLDTWQELRQHNPGALEIIVAADADKIGILTLKAKRNTEPTQDYRGLDTTTEQKTFKALDHSGIAYNRFYFDRKTKSFNPEDELAFIEFVKSN